MTDLAKLDPSLAMALQRRRRDPDKSLLNQGISVIVQFRNDVGTLQAHGFTPTSVFDDEAIGTIRFADIPALAENPNVLQISAGANKQVNIGTAVKDVHARASSATTIGTDGLWHADNTPAPGADPTRVPLTATGGATGKGVIIAVIDTGIDITHPMFNKLIAPNYSTRILRIWDHGLRAQAGEAGPNPSLLLSTTTYGVEFQTQAINDALNNSLFPILPIDFRHRDCESHGTHVTSIAAGGPTFANSADATRIGVAPEADIIMVKLLDTPDEIVDVNGNVVSADVRFRDAVTYCCRVARSLNKAVVISCSFGTLHEAGDGLDDGSRFLDRTFDPKAAADATHFPRGAILVKSAGNNGDITERAHAKVTVPDSGSITVPFEMFDDRGANRTQVVNCVREHNVPPNTVIVWYRDVPAPQDVSVAARVPSELAFSAQIFAGFLETVFDGAKVRTLIHSTIPAVQRTNSSGTPVSINRNRIILTISPNSRVNPPQHLLGIYELRLEAPPGTTFFAFCARSRDFGFRMATANRDASPLPSAQTIAGSVSPILPIEVTAFGTINSDAGSRHVITVAAYDDTDGDATHADHHSPLSISSRGPIRDFSNPALGPFSQKPDIAAPGAAISAALSKDTDNSFLKLFDLNFQQGDRFETFSGTSQATPMVAGVIALMLEKKKDMSVADVQAILTATGNVNPGRNPGPGDPGSADTFGAGRVDALKSHAGTP